MADDPVLNPLVWVGSSRKDFGEFPDEVKSEMGYALFIAQAGERHHRAKTLSAFGGPGVVEIVDDFAATRSAPCTPCGSRRRSSCCMPSRRNPSRAAQRQSPISG